MADSNRGLISYTSNPSIVESFWQLIPELTQVWKPGECTDSNVISSALEDYLEYVDILKDMHYLVYVHILPDNSVYVGMTGSSMQRRGGSGGSAYKDTIYNDFYDAMQKLGGWDVARHYVLAQGLLYDQAIAYEELFTRLFEDAGYHIFNRKYGCKGHRHTEATKQKIGIKSLGHKLPFEAKQRISKANSGRVKSQDTLEKQRKSLATYWEDDEHHKLHSIICAEGNRMRQCGKHLSETTKKKLGDARRGLQFSEEWRNHLSESHKGVVPSNAKIVIAHMPDGNLIEFSSGTACAEYFGKSHGWAIRYCNSGKSTPEGISFSYKETA